MLLAFWEGFRKKLPPSLFRKEIVISSTPFCTERCAWDLPVATFSWYTNSIEFPHPSVKCAFYNFSLKRKRASSTLGGAGSKVSHTKTHKMWMFEIVNLTDCPPKSIRRGNSSFFFGEILVGFLKHSATKKIPDMSSPKDASLVRVLGNLMTSHPQVVRGPWQLIEFTNHQ